MLIPASFQLVLESDNAALRLATVLIGLSSSLDPMNLRRSRRAPLACCSGNLPAVSNIYHEHRVYIRPLPQA